LRQLEEFIMTKIKTPSVFAYSKKIMPTNALMYSCVWGDGDNSSSVPLQTKTVLGTQSQRKGGGKTATEGNIQKVDFASLPAEHDTLKLTYLVKFVGDLFSPEMANEDEYAELVANNLREGDIKTLAYRYVYNIVAARPLWRNRVASEDVTTFIKVGDDEFTFDSLDLDLNTFESLPEIHELAELVGNVWEKESGFVTLEVEHYSRLGFGMEVYPSEEFVDKEKGRAKVLFDVQGQAAMHDQKIGNAIRTVDTWYPAAEFPIAVEPYGSVVRKGKAYRQGNKKDFYTLLDAAANKPETLTEEDKMYTIAVLIRGGVFGG